MRTVADMAMDRAGQAQEAYRKHLNASHGWRDQAATVTDPHEKRIYEELEHWQKSAAAIALSSASRFAKIAAQSVHVDRRRKPGSIWSAMNDDLVARTNKVACPQCGAKEGAFCIGPNGEQKTTTNHYSRRDLARKQGHVRRGRGNR